MNKKNKNTPTQKVDNQMAACDSMYNKYYRQSLKTSSEYCKKKLAVNRNIFLSNIQANQILTLYLIPTHQGTNIVHIYSVSYYLHIVHETI